MKLKYYMRGLGIGMVVTAFILSVVLDKDTKTMSDDEIMARARELGMVESTVLSQMAEQNKNASDESNVPESGTDVQETVETETPETETLGTETPETETTGTEVPETEPEPESEVSTEEKETEQNDEGSEIAGTVTIVITPGESSESVSRSLEDAGLVESARSFDKYLCNNGYDNVIAVGTYEIPVGISEEEIAKIITKRK